MEKEKNDTSDRPSTPDQADDGNWSSDPSTVERRDADRAESGAEAEEIVNRSGAGMRTPRRYEQQDEPEPKG